MKITVAGVGYVGLSPAVLLSRHHEVTAITTTEEKAEKLDLAPYPVDDEELLRKLYVLLLMQILSRTPALR